MGTLIRNNLNRNLRCCLFQSEQELRDGRANEEAEKGMAVEETAAEAFGRRVPAAEVVHCVASFEAVHHRRRDPL